jgi:hypothetical protein
VTQTTSRSGGVFSTASITGISTPYYRFGIKQIQKLKVSCNVGKETFDGGTHLTFAAVFNLAGQTMHEENDAKPTSISLESSTFPPLPPEKPKSSGWLRIGAVTAASALAGGLAAAWYYRKTLARLRQTDGSTPNIDFRIPPESSGEDD